MGLTYPSNKICPKCGTGGYVWYLDDSEYVAKCTNCGHYFQKEDFPMCVLDKTQKPITNADKIRNMSDEELAVWLTGFACSNVAPHANARGAMYKGKLVDWLKQEAE